MMHQDLACIAMHPDALILDFLELKTNMATLCTMQECGHVITIAINHLFLQRIGNLLLMIENRQNQH